MISQQRLRSNEVTLERLPISFNHKFVKLEHSDNSYEDRAEHIPERKKSLTRGHVEDIGSTVGIHSYEG